MPRARCGDCGRALLFDDWRKGADRCRDCLGRERRAPATAAPLVARPVAADFRRNERMLDEIPEELIEELVAALEAEAAKLGPRATTPASPLREVLNEMGVGSSPHEVGWTAWGFAIGFGANIALAKYAQMSSGASFASFAVPLFVGGMVAGMACAAIGWGLARLRDKEASA